MKNKDIEEEDWVIVQIVEQIFSSIFKLVSRIISLMFKLVLIILALSFLASIFFHFIFSNIERNDIFQTPIIESISYMSVFPKESISFSNTFIFQDDIDNLIKRHNDASFIEKVSIRQEPLHRKLIEKGFIIEKDE